MSMHTQQILRQDCYFFEDEVRCIHIDHIHIGLSCHDLK